MNRRRPDLRLATSVPRDASALVDEATGDRLLAEHGLSALRAWLDAAPARAATGWLEFWRGYAAQFDDLMRARAHWLAAEQQFEQQADAPGLELSACGLVQCMLLDNQPCDQLDRRSELVLRSARPPDAATPLGLFRLGARFVIDALHFDGRTIDAVVLEQVFSALGADAVDAPLRLRAATAAMHWIGRSIDRARAADFHQTGNALAASATISPYSRILWQTTVSTARWYDVAAVPRLAAELDVAVRDAPGPACRHLVACAWMLRAVHSLTAEDLATAGTQLSAAQELLAADFPLDRALFHFLSSRHELARGDFDAAAAHATLSLRTTLETHDLASDVTPILMQSGAVQSALGHHEEAAAMFARAAEASVGTQAVPSLCHLHLARALQQSSLGALEEARAELSAGFAQARSIGYLHFFRALPRLTAHLCGLALDLDVDPTYVRRVIAARSLASPDPGVRDWPHPLRIRGLGGFAIERDGEPLAFARRVPRRVLDVLRLAVALGGREVDVTRIAAILWPDAGHDEARDALKAALHRLRALLGPDALALRHGQLSFDARVWVDTWGVDHVCGRIETLLASASRDGDRGELELRRVQLLALYRGGFLGAADVPAWALAARERWRAGFVRSIVLLGRHLEQTGRADAASALMLAGLERENLAEELHERLIEGHLQRGEPAQALNAYRRYRELTAAVIGAAPSPRMQALRARIAR